MTVIGPVRNYSQKTKNWGNIYIEMKDIKVIDIKLFQLNKNGEV